MIGMVDFYYIEWEMLFILESRDKMYNELFNIITYKISLPTLFLQSLIKKINVLYSEIFIIVYK